MELIKLTKRMKCDIGGCKSTAEYSVAHERGSLRNRLNICKNCLTQMYTLFGKEIIPESPASVFSKRAKRAGRGE